MKKKYLITFVIRYLRYFAFTKSGERGKWTSQLNRCIS